MQNLLGHPVVIIGAGRGGTALLELFVEDEHVTVVAMVDSNKDAPGIRMAQTNGIATFENIQDALPLCKKYGDCIIYNLTHDDSVAEDVSKVLGEKKVTGGIEAKLFWQIVTNLRQIRKELEKNQSQLQAIIHNAVDGIITINESGEIQGFNPAAEKMFGFQQEEVVGRNVKMLMPEPIRSLHDMYIEEYLRTGEGKIVGVQGREVTALRKNGDLFPMELSASEMILGGLRYFIGIVRDITERKLAEQKIAYMAHHDFLTGLPNRALFQDLLEKSISLSKRTGDIGAVLLLDLDGFKGINDTMGHDAGDLLLKAVAERLREIVRSSDTLARLGGDEFTVVLNNLGNKDEASIVATKIIDVLSRPFEIYLNQCRIGCSIGITIFPSDSDRPMELIKKSDEAMYVSKQRGKNTFTFYL
jgi:diguanylate cyclase (GGDEF)-like protein/PAS domain S-box-containing protein